MLSRLNGALLHLLRQRTPGTQLAARRELHVDLAIRHVLDILFEVQLHDRIAARRPHDIGRRDGHLEFGRLLTRLLLARRCGGLFADQQGARCACDNGGGEAEFSAKFQEPATFHGFGCFVIRFH